MTTGADRGGDPWIAELTGTPLTRHAAERRLHDLLLRVAHKELHRRAGAAHLSALDREDLAHEVADDAMVAILAKLGAFNGDSRFTTWAYKFVILEVSSKLGRRFWKDTGRAVDLTLENWHGFHERFGLTPEANSAAHELADAIRSAIDNLTPRQRSVFVAVVVNGVPLDAMAAKTRTTRNAMYKMIFDARTKIRSELIANGYLTPAGGSHDEHP